MAPLFPLALSVLLLAVQMTYCEVMALNSSLNNFDDFYSIVLNCLPLSPLTGGSFQTKSQGLCMEYLYSGHLCTYGSSTNS